MLGPIFENYHVTLAGGALGQGWGCTPNNIQKKVFRITGVKKFLQWCEFFYPPPFSSPLFLRESVDELPWLK